MGKGAAHPAVPRAQHRARDKKQVGTQEDTSSWLILTLTGPYTDRDSSFCLPTTLSQPAPPTPFTTTSPAPQPSAQQDPSWSLRPTWPGAILLPYHVDHDPKLQQPLQDAHPPVPGHHILLSLVIQKPPACRGPWGAHVPSSCSLLGHMSQQSSCSHS